MKKTILTALAALFIAASSHAVPALQLYIPGSTYDAIEETWSINSGSFEIWVIAANVNTKPLFDITLVAALGKTTAPVDGGLSIGGQGYDADDFHFGRPPVDDPQMPPHGIYDTWFAEFEIGNSGGPFETVYDMQPGGGGSATGVIYKYQVEVTGYDFVHFDAYAFDKKGKFVKAPFSHDAESNSPPSIPEPATMMLFGLGLAGVGIVRRFRK